MPDIPPEIMKQLPPSAIHYLKIRLLNGKEISNVCVSESGKILGITKGNQNYFTQPAVKFQTDDIVSVQIGQSVVIQRE